MKILFIAHRIPYPPNRGDKIRSFNEIKYLSRSYEIHLACLADDPEDLKYVKDLKRYCKTVNVIPINSRLAKLKSIFYLFSKRPLSVQYFYSKKLQKAINHLLSTNNYNAIICFSSPMAEYILKARNVRSLCLFNLFNSNNSNILNNSSARRAKLIMDFVDVDSDKWHQYSKYQKFPFSLIYKIESNRLANYERKIAEKFDYSIFVSKKEADLFQKLNPDIGNIWVIQNGVDLKYFNPDLIHNQPATSNQKPETSNQQPVLLFTGAMDYYANIDGVLWFAKQIFPLIEREIPDVKFYIVGSKPTKEVKKLGNNNGIIVTGFVEDIREYLAKATIFVVPLRIARGIQNKILEAMTMGIPVVATPQSFEGIEAKPGKDLLLADTETDFIEQITELLKNKARQQELAISARRTVEKNYSWQHNLKTLERILAFEHLERVNA